jgi:putative membrane protein
MKGYILWLYLITCCHISCNTGNTDNNNADSLNTGTDSLRSNIDSLKSAAAIGDSNAAIVSTGDYDYSFAYQADFSGRLEIQMAQLAVNKTNNTRIKNLAKTILMDDKAAMDQLKRSYSFKTPSYPAVTENDMENELGKLKVLEDSLFDKSYMDIMFVNYERNIKLFKDAAKECKSDSLKTYAANTLPVLEKHFDSIKAIIKQY